jgi:hypothetical protein
MGVAIDEEFSRPDHKTSPELMLCSGRLAARNDLAKLLVRSKHDATPAAALSAQPAQQR